MNIYKISQHENTNYDTFDSCVVYAENEVEAKNMHPDGKWNDYSWASSPENVEVEFIGVAEFQPNSGFICRSFHAG